MHPVRHPWWRKVLLPFFGIFHAIPHFKWSILLVAGVVLVLWVAA